MAACILEASAWLILLSVLGLAWSQGSEFSTTPTECAVYGCLLGISVACAYLGIDDAKATKAKRP
jgi:hypothetical protein